MLVTMHNNKGSNKKLSKKIVTNNISLFLYMELDTHDKITLLVSGLMARAASEFVDAALLLSSSVISHRGSADAATFFYATFQLPDISEVDVKECKRFPLQVVRERLLRAAFKVPELGKLCDETRAAFALF